MAWRRKGQKARMDLFQRMISSARQLNKTVALAEGDEPRVIRAAFLAKREAVARIILVGHRERVLDALSEASLDFPAQNILDPEDYPLMNRFVDQYLAIRTGKNVTRDMAERILSKDIFFAAMLVRMGEADGMVAGARNLTSTVIKAGKLIVGLKSGFGEPSGFFLMDIPGHRPIIFADCAVNPNPEPALLAQIAIASAQSASALLGKEARVAMLSFSTKGSADHPDVRKVREATSIAKRLSPELLIDGEMQADAALVPQIAEKKKITGPVAGKANVLIFPDLDAGNISYKLVQHLAGAKAYGPFLQGFNRPVNDLSRGCTPEEILGTIAITAIQAGSLP